MKNTDFMNLSLPEGTDKIDIEILNNDFTAIENLLKQHAIIETMTLNGEGVIIGAIGPYIRLQNIDTVQVSIDIGKETYTLASGENMVIRETAENIGIITSGNVHITYFVNPITYADKEFYSKKKVDELLSKVEGNVEVDAELSDVSENPVQNKIITEQFSHYYTASETINAIIEKVAEIVAGAPEDYDTLKELSDWLKQHEDSAASMNSAIQKNAEDIATANTAIEKNETDIATANTRISALETLSDVISKHNESYWCTIDGYVLRVGNQVHVNLTATFKSACNAWVGSIIKFPFKVKTPDGSERYTIKQTQPDGRETSVYLQNGSTTFFTSTEFKKDDSFVIAPMILDMYVEETATTEGGE